MAKTRTSIQKGEIKNPGGRPKGSPNRTTQEMRDWIKLVIDENLDRMYDDFNNLSPATRLMLIEKYAKYIIPTLSQVKTEGTLEVDGKLEIVISYENGGDMKDSE